MRPGRRRGRRRLGPGRRGTVALAVAVALAAALVGVFVVSSGADEGAPTKTSEPPVASTTSTTVAVARAPLTGLPDPAGVAGGRSALAVKIENTPEARPQYGLDVADVVYEEVVEGGITRFWAVFNSAAPETVGPIRSVRGIDPNIVAPLGGVVAFSGGTSDNVNAIRAVAPNWVDENNAQDAFFRESTRFAPHNLFGRTALLWQRGGTPVPPAALFTYVDPERGQSFTGDPVAGVKVNFDQGYDVTYQWDPAVGWRRIQHDQPFLSQTNVPIAVTNLIVQFMVGGEGEGQLLGSGDAWVLSNGQLVKGRWSKPAAAQATQYTDAAGVPIALTPGRTWVELYPTSLAPPAVTPGVAPTTTTSTTQGPKTTATKKR